MRLLLYSTCCTVLYHEQLRRTQRLFTPLPMESTSSPLPSFDSYSGGSLGVYHPFFNKKNYKITYAEPTALNGVNYGQKTSNLP